MALKQNNLEEATTEQGFPTETSIPLQREVELEDGTIVTVEGVTPEKLATDLGITYKTPGEPYVTSDGTTLEGVCQTYNEGHSGQKFDTIVLGGSYKFKFKEKLDLIDSMTSEEIVEFFNDKDNRVMIVDDVSGSSIGNGIMTSIDTRQNMIIIAIKFIKDFKQYQLIYIPQYMTEIEGKPFSGLTPGWYLAKGAGSFEPATPNDLIVDNVTFLMNNITGNGTTPGDNIDSFDSSKLNWLLDSAESVEFGNLVSIEITTPPTKTEYNANDSFDPTGMVVIATFDNGLTYELSKYTYSPANELAETDTKITISYTKGEVTKTAEQSITVIKGLETINFIAGHTYVYDYPKLSAYITQQLISSGKMDTVDTLHILDFGCGNNPPTIELGTLEASGHGEHPGGIVQGQYNYIGFGTDYTSFGGNISEAWDPSNAFDDFLEFLTNTGIVEEEYDFTNSTFVPNENITLNLDACGETYTTSVGANINWITEKN